MGKIYEWLSLICFLQGKIWGKRIGYPFLESLNVVETRAIELLGEGKIEMLTGLLLEYDAALNCALEEKR